MNDRWVLVTGASTGIGRACAICLDQKGFSVFATIRKPIDGETLRAETSERLHTIVLDVTDRHSIAKAVKVVGERTGNGLYGLVNNAGIASRGPLECISIEEVREVFEVNVIGLMAVTQAFLPFLKSKKGRLVNIGSMSGLVALPLMSTYAASKFAVQAISDSLRVELRLLGISVSLIVPGTIQTAILEKMRVKDQELHQTTDLLTLAPYEPFLRHFQNSLEVADGLSAQEVAKAVHHALAAKKPRPRYVVGNDANKKALASYFPAKLRDWLIAKSVGA